MLQSSSVFCLRGVFLVPSHCLLAFPRILSLNSSHPCTCSPSPSETFSRTFQVLLRPEPYYHQNSGQGAPTETSYIIFVFHSDCICGTLVQIPLFKLATTEHETTFRALVTAGSHVPEASPAHTDYPSLAPVPPNTSLSSGPRAHSKVFCNLLPILPQKETPC